MLEDDNIIRSGARSQFIRDTSTTWCCCY